MLLLFLHHYFVVIEAKIKVVVEIFLFAFEWICVFLVEILNDVMYRNEFDYGWRHTVALKLIRISSNVHFCTTR